MTWKRAWLGLAGLLACLYLAYILAARLAGRIAMPIKIGEVGEFLLFLAGCLALSFAIFAAERETAAAANRPRPVGLIADLDANIERYLMLICYLFCCAVIIHDVGRRFLLNFSAGWSQETAQYAFIYLGWIGAAFAVKERAHIRFDIVINALPERLKGAVYLLGEIATLAFALIALRFTWHTLAQLWQFEGATPVLRVSKLWAEAAVTIGFLLIVLRTLQMMRRDIADLAAGRPAYAGKALFED
jgi:TRAP-type C4-dicarboxylate transport system permease small subunit